MAAAATRDSVPGRGVRQRFIYGRMERLPGRCFRFETNRPNRPSRVSGYYNVRARVSVRTNSGVTDTSTTIIGANFIIFTAERNSSKLRIIPGDPRKTILETSGQSPREIIILKIVDEELR